MERWISESCFSRRARVFSKSLVLTSVSLSSCFSSLSISPLQRELKPDDPGLLAEIWTPDATVAYDNASV